jgi:predicted nucleic acid-binding protein
MSRFILLDSGPRGQIARRSPLPEVSRWATRLLDSGARFAISAVIDYEVRRSFLQASLTDSLNVLDDLTRAYTYIPLDKQSWYLAADMWASLRKRGKPTAAEKALDIDVILAAQAQILIDLGHDDMIATTNVKHLELLAPARLWNEII